MQARTERQIHGYRDTVCDGSTTIQPAPELVTVLFDPLTLPDQHNIGCNNVFYVL